MDLVRYVHLDPTHRELGQPHYEWRRRIHKITSDVLWHGTYHLYCVVRCVCVCWSVGVGVECVRSVGRVVERGVIHQCAYSIQCSRVSSVCIQYSRG
jgi:hypothetical protein